MLESAGQVYLLNQVSATNMRGDKTVSNILVHAQVQNVCKMWIYLLNRNMFVISDIFSTLALMQIALFL